MPREADNLPLMCMFGPPISLLLQSSAIMHYMNLINDK